MDLSPLTPQKWPILYEMRWETTLRQSLFTSLGPYLFLRAGNCIYIIAWFLGLSLTFSLSLSLSLFLSLPLSHSLSLTLSLSLSFSLSLSLSLTHSLSLSLSLSLSVSVSVCLSLSLSLSLFHSPLSLSPLSLSLSLSLSLPPSLSLLFYTHRIIAMSTRHHSILQAFVYEVCSKFADIVTGKHLPQGEKVKHWTSNQKKGAVSDCSSDCW